MHNMNCYVVKSSLPPPIQHRRFTIPLVSMAIDLMLTAKRKTNYNCEMKCS